MKVAVIGDGNVGRAVFRELQNVANVNELVLVGRKRDRLKAEIDDYLDAIVLRGYSCPRLSYGGYEATAGADILLYCAGSGKMDSDRMEMLEGNCQIAESIFQQVNDYNRDGIVICLTNPVDVITMQVGKEQRSEANPLIGALNKPQPASRPLLNMKTSLNTRPNHCRCQLKMHLGVSQRRFPGDNQACRNMERGNGEPRQRDDG